MSIRSEFRLHAAQITQKRENKTLAVNIFSVYKSERHETKLKLNLPIFHNSILFLFIAWLQIHLFSDKFVTKRV
jgi:hypothetical protein